MEKKRLDIMCDIETLGRDPSCTIFQIAAMAFDITTGEIFDNFNVIADIAKEPLNKVDGNTLKWWLNTNKELLAELLNKGTVSESEMVKQFHDWIVSKNEEYDVFLWGNGILFDNNILRTHMQNQGLTYPIFYRNDRDMRTLLELASIKSGKDSRKLIEEFTLPNSTLHDAFSDVKNQINVSCECWKILI